MLKGPTVAYPEKLPLELVRAQAQKTPGAVIVISEDGAGFGRKLRYQDLNTETLGALIESVDAAVLQRRYVFLPHDPEAALDDAAYIAYTSGSTGPKKAVLRTHRSLVQRLAWDAPQPSQLHCIYPFGLARLVACLITGVPTVVMTDSPQGVTATLQGIAYSGATHLVLQSHLCERLLDKRIALPAVQRLVAMGSPLPASVISRFRAVYPHITLVDGYSSTEAGYVMQDWEPVANVSIWISDTKGKESPKGGVLVIEGPDVGLGYTNPDIAFADRGGGSHAFYSHDLAREVDGKIEFLGRAR